MNKFGIIKKVSGPLVVASGIPNAKMFDVVKVSDKKLVGEIIKIDGNDFFIQVYEETAGIGPGEPVFTTGKSLSVELAPGMMKGVYDGIQRPLRDIEKASKGAFIARGIEADAIDKSKKWSFTPTVKVGDEVKSGDVIGSVPETELILHKIMVPFGVEGKIKSIAKGNFNVVEDIAEIETTTGAKTVQMLQVWPIRKPRPINKKIVPNEPLITGQRVIDTFFPIVKGGTGCVPGPFGAGKTVIQQQIAKWSDADVTIYVGCGERGNEMTDVLLEFPELEDPKTGKSLMEKTILIANTSNMPVAAREASVYTGITIAEYYRDMGYKVALMADSTSRWAEAMREMSGRLEEMPGEEGYPAYLGSRTADFYERGGFIKCLGSQDREGSLTVIGAVSPSGGDLSEPVTQNTLRVTKVFWGLDAKLAYQRHYPSVNWLTSYSLYMENIKDYTTKTVGTEWFGLRKQAGEVLQEESSLEEIVRLVGVDALSDKEQLVLNTARSLREDFLQQNAYDPEDAFTSYKKQFLMLKSIMSFHRGAQELVAQGVKNSKILALPIKQKVIRCKNIKEASLDEFDKLFDEITADLNSLKQ